MKSGIYKITNLVNGKFYIGSSNDIEYRWQCHKRDLNNKSHPNIKLQNAWDFYGKDCFDFNIIEETSSDGKLLFEREQYHLDLWKPYIRNIGYNICETASGGDNLKNHPSGSFIINEWKEKYSKMYSGEGNPMFGKKHTEDAIQLQKEKAVGRYTLDWFVEKYGEKLGNWKYQKRNETLRNRDINYSYDNKMKGQKRGPMSEDIKKLISERKKRLPLIREDIRKDILSNQYTTKQISEKYDVSMATIKSEKRKLVNQ